MSIGNFNLAEILSQFTKRQKIFVLIFTVGMVSMTTILTTYFTSECSDIMEINEVLRADIDAVKESVAQCQRYNETLIHNNLMIIEKTNELHMKLLGNSNILSTQSLSIIPDSLDIENLKTTEIYSTPITPEEETDKIIHDILEIAKSKEKRIE